MVRFLPKNVKKRPALSESAACWAFFNRVRELRYVTPFNEYPGGTSPTRLAGTNVDRQNTWWPRNSRGVANQPRAPCVTSASTDDRRRFPIILIGRVPAGRRRHYPSISSSPKRLLCRRAPLTVGSTDLSKLL